MIKEIIYSERDYNFKSLLEAGILTKYIVERLERTFPEGVELMSYQFIKDDNNWKVTYAIPDPLDDGTEIGEGWWEKSNGN